MFAPSEFVATGPSDPNAEATIRVVVDLPLVPVTNTVRRPDPSWRSSERSSVIATRPPIIEPAPRPVTRDAHRAVAPAASAMRPRAVIIGAVYDETATDLRHERCDQRFCRYTVRPWGT